MPANTHVSKKNASEPAVGAKRMIFPPPLVWLPISRGRRSSAAIFSCLRTSFKRGRRGDAMWITPSMKIGSMRLIYGRGWVYCDCATQTGGRYEKLSHQFAGDIERSFGGVRGRNLF